KTNGTINQDYLILQGQAKLTRSFTVTNTNNTDGSTQDQEMTVNYTYNTQARLTGAAGAGHSVAGNIHSAGTTSDITQDYKIVDGQAKLTATHTQSKTSSPDDSEQTQTLHVYYRYDDRNKMAGARGEGTYTSRDGYGFSTSQGTMTQEYAMVM